jgi:thymidylate kinase
MEMGQKSMEQYIITATKFMNIESEKLKRVLEWFESQDIEYVLVGEDTSELQNSISGDIDIVVNQYVISRINTIIIDLCSYLDMKCVQVLQHEQSAYFFVVSWLENNKWHYLKLDICSNYIRNTRLLITAEKLLKNRTKVNSAFYIPSPNNNFTYYLLKKIDKNSINKNQFLYLCSQLDLCNDRLISELTQFWQYDESKAILKILKQREFKEFKSKISRWRAALHTRSRLNLKSIYLELRRLIRRVAFPTGIWIAIYGPDGCGKSSVIEKLQPALLPAFRRTQTNHFRPRLGSSPSCTSTPVLNPHASKNRNIFSSILKLGYYGLDYILGYFIKVLPAKICSTLFIFDRYYDDLIIDQKRYRYGGPVFLLKWLRFFIPKPDLIFCLDAEAEILQARKAEVSFEECKRQREAYKDLVLKLPNGYIVDSSQNLDQVVNDIQSIVLEHMNKKVGYQINKTRWR